MRSHINLSWKFKLTLVKVSLDERLDVLGLAQNVRQARLGPCGVGLDIGTDGGGGRCAGEANGQEGGDGGDESHVGGRSQMERGELRGRGGGLELMARVSDRVEATCASTATTPPIYTCRFHCHDLEKKWRYPIPISHNSSASSPFHYLVGRTTRKSDRLVVYILIQKGRFLLSPSPPSQPSPTLRARTTAWFEKNRTIQVP